MRTHSKLSLVIPVAALLGCAQNVPGDPTSPGDPGNPGNTQGGSNPPQLRYDQPLPYYWGGTPYIVDLDGDGALDMLVQPEPSGSDLYALHNRGDGTFSTHGAGNLYLGLVADLNGDGQADVVGWSAINATNLTIEMTQPGGNTTVADNAVPFNLTYPAELAAADVDGDGRPEIVASLSDGTYAMWIDGSGNVVSTQVLSSTPLSVAPDLDGDHRAELYSIDGASVSITSSRTDKTRTATLPNCLVNAVRFADLDGDGKLDLVVAAYDRTNGDLHAVTFQSNGDGSFTQRAENVISDGALDDVVDIDGDGHLDVAFRNGTDATEYFAVGDGAFHFTPSSYAVPLPDSQGTIQFADLNGDGRPDIVLSGALLYVIDSI